MLAKQSQLAKHRLSYKRPAPPCQLSSLAYPVVSTSHNGLRLTSASRPECYALLKQPDKQKLSSPLSTMSASIICLNFYAVRPYLIGTSFIGSTHDLAEQGRQSRRAPIHHGISGWFWAPRLHSQRIVRAW